MYSHYSTKHKTTHKQNRSTHRTDDHHFGSGASLVDDQGRRVSSSRASTEPHSRIELRTYIPRAIRPKLSAPVTGTPSTRNDLPGYRSVPPVCREEPMNALLGYSSRGPGLPLLRVDIAHCIRVPNARRDRRAYFQSEVIRRATKKGKPRRWSSQSLDLLSARTFSCPF